MKKVFALLLSAVSILSLAACGNSGSKSERAAETTAAQTTEAAVETTAEPASSSPAVDISS